MCAFHRIDEHLLIVNSPPNRRRKLTLICWLKSQLCQEYPLIQRQYYIQNYNYANTTEITIISTREMIANGLLHNENKSTYVYYYDTLSHHITCIKWPCDVTSIDLCLEYCNSMALKLLWNRIRSHLNNNPTKLVT